MKQTHPILVGIENVRPYVTKGSGTMCDVQPPQMLIDDFLTEGAVMGITSYPGVGKTWLAMEIGISVTSKKEFLNHFRVNEAGGVLFVGSDSSLFDYARQWRRLTRMYPELNYDSIRFLIQSEFMFEDTDEVRRLIRTHQQFHWGEPIPPTAEEQAEAERRGETAEPRHRSGFRVIIFDTLSRLTRANQNDNTEMEQVFRNIRWISEATGAAIILLHHNSKRNEFNSGDDWRGAMSQIGALDSWIQLSTRPKMKGLVGVQFKKFRGITPKDFAYEMQVSDERTAALIYSSVPVTANQRMVADKLATDITTFIKEHPKCRARDVYNALWPKYEDGYEEGGVTHTYPDIKPFRTAVNNRLTSLATAQVIDKLDVDGKAVYALPTPAEAAKPKAKRKAKKSEDAEPVGQVLPDRARTGNRPRRTRRAD